MRLGGVYPQRSLVDLYEKEQEQTKVVSQEEIRKALHRDILQQSRFTSSPSPYGQFR